MKHTKTVEELKDIETLNWINSPEFSVAWDAYVSGFRHSEAYRNARLAYRRRVNGSPSSETT